MTGKNRFKLRVVCGLLAASFIMPLSAYADYAVGLENFEKSAEYGVDLFSDIPGNMWYTENVQSAYEYGLMNGKGNNLFDPAGQITLAETISIAVRLHCIYTWGGMVAFDTYDDDLWYSPSLRYAQEYALIDAYADYTTIATRAQFAQILAASIDDVDLQPINLVEDGAIPDVDMNADYADAVYLLYRAGVLSGSDADGTFNPDSTISRAEVAAIVTRMVEPTLRKTIELSGEY